MSKNLFTAIVGNPPFQEDSVGENESYNPQIYNKFMEAAYEICDKVELIHPARFLFDAGSTPHEWNQRMLSDEHLKVCYYEPDSSKVFDRKQIPGGIAITYHDKNKNYGAIDVFTPFPQLNNILLKVKDMAKTNSMENIVMTRTAYRLTDKMHQDNPDAINKLSTGHAYDMSSNIFERLPEIFFDNAPLDGHDYIRMLGRLGRERVYKYIRRDYVKEVKSLDYYKVIISQADGAAGTIGKPIPARVIGTPTIEGPGTGTTESFITIGCFDSKDIAENARKFVKSKFTRSLVGILKVTQAIPPGKWKYVPLQDFTSSSDIDWSKSIHEIDQQLYAKYGLSEDEINFIETHVKEMA